MKQHRFMVAISYFLFIYVPLLMSTRLDSELAVGDW